MTAEIEFQGSSFVLLGNFNPEIFRPEWFGKVNLLGNDDVGYAKEATSKVIHEDISIIETEWFSMEVQKLRMVARASEPHSERLRDLVVNTFKSHLAHTPVGAVGINREVHFHAGSFEAREKLGLMLAPREPWGQWGQLTTEGEGNDHGGLIRLTLEQRAPADRPKGFIRTTIEPSNKIKQRDGVYMQVNDHFEIEDANTPAGSDEIVTLIEDNFDQSRDRADSIVKTIMDQADAIQREIQ